MTAQFERPHSNMSGLSFTLLRGGISEPRTGLIEINGITLETPVFMPVGTRGIMRACAVMDPWEIGYRLVLANTYHLVDRPGPEYLNSAHGLCSWNGWPGLILTDSGGYQAFSLSGVRKITEDGVSFRSVTDGRPLSFTPESVIAAQRAIGSHIMMPLDHCPPLPAPIAEVSDAVERTARWLERSVLAWDSFDRAGALFGIVQGGTDPLLRVRSAQHATSLPMDGFSIGGLAVGERAEDRAIALAATTPFLPANKPRYLMGVGYPEDIVQAVRLGVDMFDCVIPSREARHGRLYSWTSEGVGIQLWPGVWYDRMSIKQGDEESVIDAGPAGTLRASFLRYLFKIGDPSAQRYATLANLKFYFELMQKIRKVIHDDGF